MRIVCLTILGISFAALSSPVFACDKQSGQRQQMIYLDSGGVTVEFWEMVPGQIKSVKLPNGRVVGISAAPAAAEKYKAHAKVGKFVPELVEIRLYDMAGSEPKETHMSWGGANSLQGFKDFTLNFLKPVCVATGT